MGKRIHDGNWWLKHPKRLWPQILHTPKHIFTPCDHGCPISNKPIFENPYEVKIDEEVEIGAKTIIKLNVTLEGATEIGKGCRLGPNVTLTDCRIGDRVLIGHGAQLKRCIIDDGVKIPHVSYLGDTEIGEDTNVGYDTGTSNFDGVKKNRTVIGARCFIGTFVDIIAPVAIGDESYVASRTRLSSKIPIPPHSFIYEEVRNGFARTVWRENCSFKSPHHWIWLWTKVAIDPKLMTHFFSKLKGGLGDYKEWLATPHPQLSNREPRNFVKEYGESGIWRIINVVGEKE